MKLWCFLHAFQRSPYRYLYLADILKALESSFPQAPTLESVFFYLESHHPSQNWWAELRDHADKIEKQELKLFDSSRFRFAFYGQPDFPVSLMNCSNPPLAICVQGSLDPFQKHSIGAVGSREPHEFSKMWMKKEFYQFLKDHRVPVVSGGARGIDQWAHRMAIVLDLPTLAIMPSGLANKYPPFWEPSSQWEEEGVTFISEMRLASPISKQNFSSRNRLIAAMGTLTLIVEARAKSGTLMTAHHALMESKPVCVVPGHPCLPQFAGSLQLIIEGACFARNALDLGEIFKSEIQVTTGNIGPLVET